LTTYSRDMSSLTKQCNATIDKEVPFHNWKK